MRRYLLVVGMLAAGWIASPARAEDAHGPLSGASFFVSPQISFDRLPTLKKKTPAIESSVQAALSESLRAQGASIVLDEHRADFVVKFHAKKGHSDRSVDGLTTTFVCQGRVSASIIFDEVKDYQKWASQTASVIAGSAGMLADFDMVRERRLVEESRSMNLSVETLRLVRAKNALVAVFPKLSGIDDTLARWLREQVEAAAAAELSPLGYTVLTDENRLTMVAEHGGDPMKASEGATLQEAARELKATLFAVASLSQVKDGDYVFSLKFFDQRSGRQLSSLIVSASSPEEVRAEVGKKVTGFFRAGLVNLARLRLEEPSK